MMTPEEDNQAIAAKMTDDDTRLMDATDRDRLRANAFQKPASEVRRESIASMLDMLRSKGVYKFKSTALDGFEVEFHAPTDDTKPAPVAADPDLCRCGHPLFAHAAGGMCLIGCNAEKCVDADTIP